MNHVDEIATKSVDALQAQLAVIEALFTMPPGLDLVSTPILLTLKEKLKDEQLCLNKLLVMATQQCARR